MSEILLIVSEQNAKKTLAGDHKLYWIVVFDVYV